MNNKKVLFAFLIIYGILCNGCFTMIRGINIEFLIGTTIGILIVIINYLLLEYVIDSIIYKNKTLGVFPIHLGRLLLFGLVGYFCLTISKLCILAYAIGIIGLPTAAVAASLWEVKHDTY